MARRHAHQGPPSALHSALELRVLLEMGLLPVSLPLLMMAPRGDGHPVLLLPGFMGSESSLAALEFFLRQRGWQVETWGLGRNVGFHAKHASALEQKIRHLHHKTGRKVSLVGWSLGGVFALYGAHQVPECVRSVVTLGSPLSVDPEGSASPPFVKAMYRLIAHPMGPSAHAMQPRAKKLRERHGLPMPLSCLYFAERRRRAAAGSHHRRQPGAAREHPRAGQPRGPGLQRDGAVDRGRPAVAARGPVDAFRAARGRGDGVPAADPRRAAGLAVALAGAFGFGFVAGLRASASSSWKLSRTHCVKASGSGISSRQDVGEITIRPS